MQQSDGSAQFLPLAGPSPNDVQWVAKTVRSRVFALLEQRGTPLDDEGCETNTLQLEHPALAHVYTAAVSGTNLEGRSTHSRPLAAIVTRTPSPLRLVANVDGLDVHAEVVIDGRDRKAVERLARYLARPAIAQERLTRRDDGMVHYAFRQPRKNGQRGVTLDDVSFVSRLAALIPPPGSHLFLYYGVLAPHHKLRPLVVPKPNVPPPKQLGLFVKDFEGTLMPSEPPPRSWDRTPRQRLDWARLMRRVFGEHATDCPVCGARLRVTQLATTPRAIPAVLERHGVPGSRASARAPPQQQLRLLSEPREDPSS